MNAKKLKFKPWLHPYVASCLQLAVAERVQRWLAGSVEASLSHKYRGRHWARCARENARFCIPESQTSTAAEKAYAARVQKELHRRYRVVDAALMSGKKRNPSQRAVDYFDHGIKVEMKEGRLHAQDTSCSMTRVWDLATMFPRTSPLSITEAKNVVSYFHRLRHGLAGRVGGLPPKELPRPEAIVQPVWKPLDVTEFSGNMASIKRHPIKDTMTPEDRERWGKVEEAAEQVIETGKEAALVDAAADTVRS
jgi:hypothetical protein